MVADSSPDADRGFQIVSRQAPRLHPDWDGLHGVGGVDGVMLHLRGFHPGDYDSYFGAPSEGGARESPAGFERVVRSGSWRHQAKDIRAPFRVGLFPRVRSIQLGFRLSRFQ